jgi:hypothetical protein
MLLAGISKELAQDSYERACAGRSRESPSWTPTVATWHARRLMTAPVFVDTDILILRLG